MSVLPSGKISSVIKLGYGSIQPSTFKKMLQVIILSLYINLIKILQYINNIIIIIIYYMYNKIMFPDG